MDNEKNVSKKWVGQSIVCVAIFLFLYMCSVYDMPFSKSVNNFRTYALVHNTDFKWIFNNTVSTMSTVADMLVEGENEKTPDKPMPDSGTAAE